MHKLKEKEPLQEEIKGNKLNCAVLQHLEQPPLLIVKKEQNWVFNRICLADRQQSTAEFPLFCETQQAHCNGAFRILSHLWRRFNTRAGAQTQVLFGWTDTILQLGDGDHYPRARSSEASAVHAVHLLQSTMLKSGWKCLPRWGGTPGGSRVPSRTSGQVAQSKAQCPASLDLRGGTASTWLCPGMLPSRTGCGRTTFPIFTGRIQK